MTNANTQQYRGSLGNVLEAAGVRQSAKPVYRARAAAPATPAVDESKPVRVSKPRLIEADPIRMSQLAINTRVIPYTGWEGRIQPRIGYLIDLLKLDYVTVTTELGTHLVVLRNEHQLRQNTDSGTLHHFFMPRDSHMLLAVEGTIPGSKDEIEQGILRSEDQLTFMDSSYELELAFAVDPNVFAQLNRTAWATPAGDAAMITWHRDLICDGMNH